MGCLWCIGFEVVSMVVLMMLVLFCRVVGMMWLWVSWRYGSYLLVLWFMFLLMMNRLGENSSLRCCR